MIGVLIVACVLAGPREAAPAQVILRPEEAMALVVADTLTLPPESRPFVRYVWDHNGAAPPQAIAFTAVSALNHAGRIPLVDFIAQGRIARLDFTRFAAKEDELLRLLTTWEKFGALDPSLYISTPFVTEETIDVPKYIHTDGKPYTKRREKRIINVVSFSAHVDPEAGPALAVALNTRVPMVRADVFVAKSLSTISGGLYYEFRNFAHVDGVDRDVIFARFGVDLQNSVNLAAIARATRSISEVTGKPRAVLVFQGQGGLDNQGLVSLTLDYKNPIDPARHPIRNLTTLEADAGEAFIERRDGFLESLLFDARGELQFEVPNNIASDFHVPPPNEPILQPMISCIKCHSSRGAAEKESFQGWIPVGKMIPQMVKQGVNIVGDLARVDQRRVVDELAAEYMAQIEKRMARARDDFAQAVFRATGGWDVKRTAQAVEGIHKGYEYARVDAKLACEELGVAATEENARLMLATLLPPIPLDASGISPHDPILTLPMVLDEFGKGYSVTRRDWELVLPDALFRSSPNVQEVRKHAIR